MSPQSLAETLFPLAEASAILPRNKLHSPFSPLVGWLSTLWAADDREAARTDHFLIPADAHLFGPPTNFDFDFDLDFAGPSHTNTPPSIHSIDSAGISLRDSDNDNDSDEDEDEDEDASELRLSLLRRPSKHGLTEEEFDYVVNSLLEYLEDAELESGCEEHEYYAPPEKTGRSRLRGLWYAPFRWSSFYLILTHPCH